MDPEQRVSTAEREAAVEALGAHVRAGRLSGAEYEDRSQAAKGAVTWADLNQLFADLPEPHPAPVAGRLPEPATAHPVATPEPPGQPGLIPAPYGPMLLALSPFIALGLFLATHLWWWFLLIPVMGIVINGPHNKEKS